MTEETRTVPVFLRVGDLAESEIGTLEIGVSGSAVATLVELFQEVVVEVLEKDPNWDELPGEQETHKKGTYDGLRHDLYLLIDRNRAGDFEDVLLAVEKILYDHHIERVRIKGEETK